MARGDFRDGRSITIPATESWKERAERLEAALQTAIIERAEVDELMGELQGRLDEIADIAAPDRAQADERVDRIERALSALLRKSMPEEEAEAVLRGETEDV